jgi:HD-GYP domain-containing protein (c-di-GMP phosphodiesterase class II)
LEEVTIGAFSALVRLLEERTPQFTGHSRGVADLSRRLATELGFPATEITACKTAGFLHDIGMITVPDRILENPNPLNPEEAARVKEHCRIGKELLDPFPHLGPVPDYVFKHHERVDGSGYPEGLEGDEIPLGAQIIALADSFRALVETRPFRPAHTKPEAVEILLGTTGILHAPELLKALSRVVVRSQA